MRRTGLVVIGVAVVTALLVWWLSAVEVQPAVNAVDAPQLESSAPIARTPEPGPPQPGEIRIEGRVISAESGKGLAYAEVDFDHLGVETTVKTGKDGNFLFKSPLAGSWSIVGVRAADHLPHWGREMQFELEPGGFARDIQLELEFRPPTLRRGRVVDTAGRPLESATIRLITFSFAGRAQDGTGVLSDDRGEFEVSDTGEERFEVSHPCCLTTVVSPEADAEVFVITLVPTSAAPRALFSGIVVDEDGRPVAGASIEGAAISVLLPVAQGLSLTSDSAGRFSVEVPAGASIDVEATYGDAASGDLLLQPTGEARLVVLAKDGAVSGRVIDSAGRPVTNFTVTIISRWFGTQLNVNASDGNWRVTGVPKIPYGIVEVSAAGFIPPSRNPISVARGQEVTGVDFVLEPGRSLSGFVFDQETNQPLARAAVKAGSEYDTRKRGNGITRSDERGRFTLDGLTADRLDLHIQRTGYRGHELTVGPDDREVRIGMTPSTPSDDKRVANYEGVGMRFGSNDVPDAGQGYFVDSVHPEGGAKVAGVEVGDEVLAAGGVAAGSMPTQEFLRQIKGPAGTVVTLTIRRRGAVFDLHAVRRRLQQW